MFQINPRDGSKSISLPNQSNGAKLFSVITLGFFFQRWNKQGVCFNINVLEAVLLVSVLSVEASRMRNPPCICFDMLPLTLLIAALTVPVGINTNNFQMESTEF